VDKYGNPDPSAKDGFGIDGSEGMGWFPGYAINVDTGERLNIMFGEDSSYPEGRDMLFKPNSDDSVSFGARHYLYIVGSMNTTPVPAAYTAGLKRTTDLNRDCPAYDGCQWLRSKFQDLLKVSGDAVVTDRVIIKNQIYDNVLWTTIPINTPGTTWLANDCTVKLRVARPYRRYCSRWGEGVPSPVNNNMPTYTFTTEKLAPELPTVQESKTLLDDIRVVPNPYYGASAYETSQLDNRIKIVNLPDRATVSIYTVSGTLIRRLEKVDQSELYMSGNRPSSSVEWDLKNHALIPVASGVYIIHINAPGVGEKTIKWFGVMRQTDINAF
jgi:hypothetical protein